VTLTDKYVRVYFFYSTNVQISYAQPRRPGADDGAPGGPPASRRPQGSYDEAPEKTSAPYCGLKRKTERSGARERNREETKEG